MAEAAEADRRITVQEEAGRYISEINLDIPISWWIQNNLEGRSEFMARALVLVLDRFHQQGLSVIVELEKRGIRVKVLPGLTDHAVHQNRGFPDMGQIQQELEKLPTLGTCLCPCGCGADLSLRECLRARVAVKQGVVCLTPTAFAVRDATHPLHHGHGIKGWAHHRDQGDLMTSAETKTHILCGCGETLTVEFHYAVNEGLDQYHGGEVGEEVAKGIRLYWDEVKRQKEIEVRARNLLDNEIKRQNLVDVYARQTGRHPTDDQIEKLERMLLEYQRKQGV